MNHHHQPRLVHIGQPASERLLATARAFVACAADSAPGDSWTELDAYGLAELRAAVEDALAEREPLPDPSAPPIGHLALVLRGQREPIEVTLRQPAATVLLRYLHRKIEAGQGAVTRDGFTRDRDADRRHALMRRDLERDA